jgi:hypothetical protein
MPPERRCSLRQHVLAFRATMLIEIGDARADDRNGCAALHAGELTLEPVRPRHIIGVQSGRITPCRTVETKVERGGEPGALGVADDHEPGIVEPVEDLTCAVGRGVVDHEELEVPNGLPEHTGNGLPDEAGIVVRGEEDGNERHGRLAYGAWR